MRIKSNKKLLESLWSPVWDLRSRVKKVLDAIGKIESPIWAL